MENGKFIRNVLIKTLVLFIICNLLFAVLPSLDWLDELTVYNWLVPGRERLPFGEDQRSAYNLSLYDLDAMFRSHEVSAKNTEEFRVFVIGDSSTWGTLLKPDETINSYLNEAAQEAGYENITFYNLGYPTLSLFKDVLMMSESLRYGPDAIIWIMTLESFPLDKQLASPIVQNNPEAALSLIEELNLSLDTDVLITEETLWDKTIIAKRRELADLLRLQVLGFMWRATGIDQVYPDPYVPAQRDLEANEDFHGWEPSDQLPDDFSFNLVLAGLKTAGNIPVLIVNEPIMISTGENSDIRYNFYYPRWAYDLYRMELKSAVDDNNWWYLDCWNLVAEERFTNSAIHMDPEGTKLFSESIFEEFDREVLQEGVD